MYLIEDLKSNLKGKEIDVLINNAAIAENNSIEILIKILVIYPDDKNYFDKLISCFNLSSKEDEAINFFK